MNAQQLKNAILQEAIEGRLVPQDPNDEPASVLLQRIRKEKERLVKEGKLKKKDLEVIPISEDEKPFEIPESWEWCRVSDISESFIGLTYKPTDVSERGWIVLRSSNIQDGKLYYNDIVRVNLDVPAKLHVRENDIIICARNGSKKLVGKSAIVKEVKEPMTFGAFMAVCRTSFYKYMSQFLLSPLFFSQLRKNSDTTTINQLTQKDFNSYLVPLPPLAEQHRIVAKIEELLPKVEEYGKAQEALDKLNAKLPEKLKNSILQEAISGRLVPQDPNDEPASILLDRIRQEKQRLVKEGKLKKKDLEEKPISEDEIPFEIPESWEWCRVSSILNILDSQRKPVTKSDRETGSYPYCGANGILDYVKDYIFDGSFILVGEDGSVVTKYGNPIVNKIEGKIWVNNHAHILQEFGELGYQEFIYYALMNTDISIYIHGFMPKYSQGDLRKTIIPLPPLAEQHRIVAKLEQLLGEIDKLKV